MSDIERHRREQEDMTAAYSAAAVGVGLVVAAILIIITAQTAAAGFPFVIGAAACLGWGIFRIAQQRRSLPLAVSKERELLSAIRENGGSITPAEAAMETSLTVREADGMLSELAGAGHLMVESRGGALSYALPDRRSPEIGSRTAE